MSTIRKTIDVSAAPDTVWAKIADVSSISNLIGFLENSTLNGQIRVCTLSDGGTLEEEIISVDSDLQRVVYSIRNSPLNLSFHVAAMELEQHDGGTRVTWTVDLKPDEAAQHMEPMLEAACRDMQTTLA